MAPFRVFAAVSWFVAVLNFSLHILYEEPLGGGGWFIIVTAIVYTTLKLIEDAIDAFDGIRGRTQI